MGETVLGVGFRSIALKYFRHEPPTPREIEEAIAAIEDEIALAQPPRRARVVSSDAMVRDIAAETGGLAREAVEQAFERCLRRPPGNERMAALLILRELMHHLEIASIEIRPSD